MRNCGVLTPAQKVSTCRLVVLTVLDPSQEMGSKSRCHTVYKTTGSNCRRVFLPNLGEFAWEFSQYPETSYIVSDGT